MNASDSQNNIPAGDSFDNVPGDFTSITLVPTSKVHVLKVERLGSKMVMSNGVSSKIWTDGLPAEEAFGGDNYYPLQASSF